MNNTKIIMFGHGGHDNHGCEAIIRSTSKLLKEKGQQREITVASYKWRQDSEINIKDVDKYIAHCTDIKKYTLPWLKSIYFNKVSKDYESSFMVSQRGLIKEAMGSDICLSVGGDNYCYGEPTHLYALDYAIKKSQKKLILWAASIEPDGISKRMIEDLKLFDALFTRESITYNTLKRLNINKNLFLYPDPAFTMEKEEVTLLKGWNNGNMIGLNLSPLIMKYENGKGATLTAFLEMVKYIIQNTDLNIVLIPHVVLQGNNDYEPLEAIYKQFKHSGRIILMGTNYTAPQIKYIISKCRLFIGARTHATIAAYSSCVPTLVIGYSVKSKGIARDIFGDENGYVVPVQQLNDCKQILEGLQLFLTREEEIRQYLKVFMPEYINKAKESALKLQEFFTQGK